MIHVYYYIALEMGQRHQSKYKVGRKTPNSYQYTVDPVYDFLHIIKTLFQTNYNTTIYSHCNNLMWLKTQNNYAF